MAKKKKKSQKNTWPLLQRGTRGSQYNHPFLFCDFLMVEIDDKGKRLQHMVHQETRKKNCEVRRKGISTILHSTKRK
jgi:hypothetical protein